MKKKNATLKLRILLSIFALNSITLYLYYFSRPDYLRHRNGTHFAGVLKPWPKLPSFFPWEGIKEVPFGSCEAYFGNGFTRRVDALKKGSPESRRKMGSAAGGGWFRCFYSETLQSSVCEGGGIRMNVGRIRMSRGGEELPAVIGRAEEEELPEFEDGAFEIEVVGKGGIGNGNGKKLVDEEFLDRYVPNGVVDTHTMRGLIDSIRLVGSDEFRCDEWIEEPTLLVTRFEYANLFHTFTDWYSAYVASRVTGLPNRPQLVFVDGHCKTQLEETWNALFSSLRYAKSFNGSVCFRHAILAPLGYETALFKGLTEDIDCDGASADELRQNPDDHKTARLSEFGEMIKAAFDLPVITDHVSNPLINILFVRREDYLAHPRHGGKVQSRLTNEEEVFDSLRNMVASSDNFTCELNITNGLFAHMSMKEQIQAISGASVISGAHGAGLTHIISAAPKTVVLEVVSSEFRRPHFALIAKWRGLEYHPIYLDGSTANPPVVVEKLRSILRNLGC